MMGYPTSISLDTNDSYYLENPFTALYFQDDPRVMNKLRLNLGFRMEIEGGATECSLHFDEPTQTWVYLWSRGFGATTLAIRTAAALTGPWSAPVDVLRPAESSVPNAFVYAGKAHPHLRGADGSIPVTFADNSFTFADVLDPARARTLYWPHVARLVLRK